MSLNLYVCMAEKIWHAFSWPMRTLDGAGCHWLSQLQNIVDYNRALVCCQLRRCSRFQATWVNFGPAVLLGAKVLFEMVLTKNISFVIPILCVKFVNWRSRVHCNFVPGTLFHVNFCEDAPNC